MAICFLNILNLKILPYNVKKSYIFVKHSLQLKLGELKMGFHKTDKNKIVMLLAHNV